MRRIRLLNKTNCYTQNNILKFATAQYSTKNNTNNLNYALSQYRKNNLCASLRSMFQYTHLLENKSKNYISHDLDKVLSKFNRKSSLETVTKLLKPNHIISQKTFIKICRREYLDIIKLLVNNNNDIIRLLKIEIKWFITKKTNVEMIEYLVKNGAKTSNFDYVLATIHGNYDLVKYTDKSCYGPGDRITALNYSISQNHYQIFCYLAKEYYDSHQELDDSTIKAALESSNIKFVKYLVTHNKIKLIQWIDFMYVAVENDNLEIYEIVENKILNSSELTPSLFKNMTRQYELSLRSAACRGKHEFVCSLVNKIANLGLKINLDGISDSAWKNGYHDIYRYIENFASIRTQKLLDYQ
ncbi:ankyrin repeat protein [Megavirus chiliensis]|uniref:Ankyrin repeat protein n=2 Tax=Megamimivirinae TaxID=3044648 RepID=A0A2L2DNN1_MIMIV|nr:putative ankyrin repeat protein [Megavirus chiliensis]AEQ33121.1 ankyrin repeat protein [Megavirus chiliensis]AVG47789.1 ankyrin repeat protein [Acanthamoeba polyphaga mimivirus]